MTIEHAFAYAAGAYDLAGHDADLGKIQQAYSRLPGVAAKEAVKCIAQSRMALKKARNAVITETQTASNMLDAFARANAIGVVVEKGA